jgi:2-succinyl-5-enolpyruvyl-6-hydroxy-3-cyclohexene-1-carboxylate synthase
MMTATDTHLLLRALCDELGRCGVEHACTSPGSRNSPILVSLVRDPRIRCWSHIDERCAGFFALGAAKAGGRPVVVTCTSGTAAANLAPAVIEAWQARIPLLVLTADRPAELRDVGAGQAIDQLKLYGDAVKWFVEIEPPDAAVPSLRWIRQLACRAYWTAVEGRPGPVHLNLPLREPLVLDGPLSEDLLPGRADRRPWVGRRATRAVSPPVLRGVPRRGVLVAGRFEHAAPGNGSESAGAGEAAARFASRAGWPLLADPLSGARHATNAVATYDLLLRDPGFAASVRPEIVIRVGDLPTSKPLRAWLGSLGDVDQVTIDPDVGWHDPDGVVSELDCSRPADALDALGVSDSADSSWLEAWRSADHTAGAALRTGLGDELSEPFVAASICEWIGSGATLFCAASMPIRDLELYMPAGRPLPRILSNRGANGIDGTVSAAFGVAAAGDRPVVLLIGDVALAHDVGGLIAASRLHLDLTIVLLNNDGGGIFNFLAISGESDAFAEHIATPHGLRFEHAAALYGLEYERPVDAEGLRAAVIGSSSRPGCRVIEVGTERVANVALHRRLAQAGLRALRD